MKPRSTVLAYHGIGSCDHDRHNLFVPQAAFERQMEHLARSRRAVVPLSSIVKGSARAGAVAITFDDAYVSVLEAAAPVLRAHGFPATVFLPTAYVGGRNTWDEPSSCPVDILDTDGLRALAAHGLDVQSHGHAHIDMSEASADEVRDDLARSVRLIEEVTGRPPVHLAYPFGRSNGASRRAAEDAGFHAAFSIDLPHAGRFAWERVQVTPRDGSALFAVKITGRYMGLRHSPLLDGAYRVLKRATGR